jgi:O-antigen/teichoic acid export membrane protein
VAGLVFALGGGWLLGLVYGPGYRSGAATLALLSAGNVVAAWTGPCGIILAMCGRERLFLALTAAVTTVTVTAMIILVPATGPLGAAAVAACGFAVLNIALMLAARRTEGIWTCVGIRSVCPRVRRSAGRHRAKAPVRTGGALE